MIKTILKELKQYKRPTILGIIFTILEVVFDVLIPYVIARLIDLGIQARDVAAIWKYGGIMVLLALLMLATGVASGRCAAAAAGGFATNVRAAMYRKIQKYSFANIDRFTTASLVTRMTTDVSNLQNAFQMAIRIGTRTPVMLVTAVVMCVITSPSMSLIFLAAIPVLGIGLAFIHLYATKYFRQAFQKYDALNSSVEENVAAARVVKAYVREDYEKEKFNRATRNLRHIFEMAQKAIAFNAPLMNFVVFGCILSLSWFGAKQIVGGRFTTGELTSMFTYVMQILISLMMLSMILVFSSMALAGVRRIAEVLSEAPDLENPKNGVKVIEDGSIDFDNVTFRYHAGGEPVLRDVDLHIRSGETIGIIGGTGSGKSSLVGLLSRLYDVAEGSVKVGGRDVREYDLTALRNSVSVVLQKNVLFSGTVLSNLRWGKADATLEECRAACALACADEFIDKLPDGYDSRVEQGGSNFSGGQKQRLCIARALLKSPKILVLDDSTSAVDTATDARIRRAFRTVIPDTTKIIIAQRIASVRDADRIIVMDDGKITGFDTPENLLRTNPLYQEIYEMQTRDGGDFDEPQAV